MEVGMGGGSGDFLPDYGHQLAMMKDSRFELLLPRMQHSFVKRNLDLDWRFDPASTTLFVLPAFLIIQALAALSAQLSINKSPIPACNILRTKIWVSNYLEEVPEARLRLFFTVIPIPFSQQKRGLGRIRTVVVDRNSGRDIWRCIHQVVGYNILGRIMIRETSCMIFSEKPKYIPRRFEDLSDMRQMCWGFL
jgi:hypothetical protein